MCAYIRGLLAVVLVHVGARARAQVVTLGPPGNVCPENYPARLTTIAACRAGMHEVGHNSWKFIDVENEADWPVGCYFCRQVAGCYNGAWLNLHPTGNANGGATPYCARSDFMPPVAGHVLLVGDSDIDLWPMTAGIADSYNVGVSGATCADVLSEIDMMLDTFSPAVVIIVCGENDLCVCP